MKAETVFHIHTYAAHVYLASTTCLPTYLQYLDYLTFLPKPTQTPLAPPPSQTNYTRLQLQLCPFSSAYLFDPSFRLAPPPPPRMECRRPDVHPAYCFPRDFVHTWCRYLTHAPPRYSNPIPSSLGNECRKAARILSSFVDPRQSFGPDKIIPPSILSNAKVSSTTAIIGEGRGGEGGGDGGVGKVGELRWNESLGSGNHFRRESGLPRDGEGGLGLGHC